MDINDEDTVLFFMGFLYNFAGLKEIALELANGESSKFKTIDCRRWRCISRITRYYKKHDLSSKVILAGLKSYSEIPELVAASDICILPAYPDEKIMQDIVPIKIYEYMAMGKPVITTKLPGIMMEFGEGNGIFYVDKPSDVVLKGLLIIDIIAEGRKAHKICEKNDWNKDY